MYLLLKMANVFWSKDGHKSNLCSSAKVIVLSYICYMKCNKPFTST